MYCGVTEGVNVAVRCALEDGEGKEGRGGEGKGDKYLCTTSSVLRSTARYELRVVVLEQVFVQAHVLFFGEDGIVGLEAVFGEHCFIARPRWSEFRRALGRWCIGAYPWP